MHIKVTKGLDIPIKGKPKGEVSSLPFTTQVSLNLAPFEETKFTLLVTTGEVVKIGQPIAADKDCPSRLFVSPAAGVIKDIRRGAKRRLLDIVIDVSRQEYTEIPKVDVASAHPEELLDRLQEGGLFTDIRQRPFNILADPRKRPRSIFVKAIETAPFAPPAELQVAGYEKEFQTGLQALSKLTHGKVHLVYNTATTCRAFLKAEHVEHHTIEGPHPAG